MDGNKKIGILTFHDTINFGATLQAAALYKIINEMGCLVEIVNYHCAEIDRRELPEYKYASSDKLRGILKYILIGYKKKRKHNELLKYLQSETRISEKYYNRDNIHQANQIYDCFIVGSDMLWNIDFTLSDYTYMLDFVARDKEKYAFATSGMFHSSQEAIRGYLNCFDQIAVREERLATNISNLLDRRVYHVCDPTMLVKPEIWRGYLNHSFDGIPYCLMYFDDNEGNVRRAITEYSKQKNIRAKNIGFSIAGISQGKVQTLEIYSIEEFLSTVANARMFFTASYHGMLFAVYFHVPFVYYNKDSDRLESIAKKLGLEKRNGNKYDINEMDEIDWKKVDGRREQFRMYSLDILRSMLHVLE